MLIHGHVCECIIKLFALMGQMDCVKYVRMVTRHIDFSDK